MDCAIEVIAEEGFAQASLARIAQRAGVAKSVVLYHFANKDELVEQVLMAVGTASIDGMPERLAAERTARDKLRVALEIVIGFIPAHRTQVLAALETSNMMRSLPARARVTTTTVEGVEELLAEGQRNGEFGEFDPHVVAVMVRQGIEAAALEFAINPDADMAAFTAEVVALFDRATRADRP